MRHKTRRGTLCTEDLRQSVDDLERGLAYLYEFAFLIFGADIVNGRLGKSESFDEYKALLEKEKPLISTLCNAAGFGRFALFTEVDLETNLRMIDLNDKATVAMTQLTLPYMKRGSRVINIDSLSAFQPVPYQCVYGSTKAFVLSFSRALNVELEPRGIRVMAVSPGWVQTEFFDHAVSDNGAVTYYDKLWTPAQVAERAMRDYKKGRDLSILGASVRRQVFLVKLLPHKLVMKIWMKQQGHAHRPPED